MTILGLIKYLELIQNAKVTNEAHIKVVKIAAKAADLVLYNSKNPAAVRHLVRTNETGGTAMPVSIKQAWESFQMRWCRFSGQDAKLIPT